MSSKESGISFLVLYQVIAETNKVILPPKTIAGTVLINLAVKPDSNCPISLDEPINIEFTAETLPLILSGVQAAK